MNYPIRKKLRADFHEYDGGDYFVTICVKDMKCCLGHIANSTMHYNKLGKFCHKSISEIPNHFSTVEVPLFVIMPNHIHLIISIYPKSSNENTPLLGNVISGFKRSVKLYAKRNNIDFYWQRSYYDHIIRNTKDGNNISEYIQSNVARWEYDRFYNL